METYLMGKSPTFSLFAAHYIFGVLNKKMFIEIDKNKTI